MVLVTGKTSSEQDDGSTEAKTFTVIRKQGNPTFWDRFSVSPIPFYCCFLIVPVQYLLLRYYGSFYGLLLLAFVVVPLLDILLPHDLSDPSDLNPAWNDPLGKLLYKVPLYTWPFLSAWELFWGCSVVAERSTDLSWIDMVGLTMSIGGFTGAVGITIAHELLHKPNRLEKVLAYSLLSLTSYMHFVDEHQYGHHKWVSTPLDPATAKFGQSFFSFYPQTVFGSWKSAWEMNAEKLKIKGQSIWSFSNRMIWFLVFPCIIGMSLALYFNSWKVLIFFYAQAIVGFSYLELVNYIEHYGLLRTKLENGNYEPVNVTHSWNAPHRISNYFLFKLQRHSDHHAHALRPYQMLRNFLESPELPAGYTSMVLLALIPSWFFQVMDPVIELYNKDKSNGLKFTRMIQSSADRKVVLLAVFVATYIFFFTGNSQAASAI